MSIVWRAGPLWLVLLVYAAIANASVVFTLDSASPVAGCSGGTVDCPLMLVDAVNGTPAATLSVVTFTFTSAGTGSLGNVDFTLNGLSFGGTLSFLLEGVPGVDSGTDAMSANHTDKIGVFADIPANATGAINTQLCGVAVSRDPNNPVQNPCVNGHTLTITGSVDTPEPGTISTALVGGLFAAFAARRFRRAV